MRKPLVNDGRHITKIITTTICRKHKAGEGEPCFVIQPGSHYLRDGLLGICGGRVKRAGYNGHINPLSLRLKTSGGRTGGKKH
jgi:hypothetical protein